MTGTENGSQRPQSGRQPWWIGRTRLDALWTGLHAGVAGVAGSFAVAGPTTHFVAVPITDLVVAVTPGPVTAVAIKRLGQASELLAFGTALALSVVLVGAAAVVGARVGRRFEPSAGPLLGAYFGAWGVAALILRAPFAALAAAIPAVVVVWLRTRSARPRGQPPGRRAVLKAGVGLLGGVGLASAIGLRRSSVETSPLSAIPASERDVINQRLAEAERRSLDVDGIPGLVTPLEAFYEVDINPVNPDVDAADWTLSITGAVDRPMTLNYGDLTNRPIEHRHATLRCVGERLNGHEMDSALWTGVPISDLLGAVEPSSDCACVMLHGVDGYYEEFPLAALEPGMVAFGMNGRLLPRQHGFPARALVPGHWGEVNVKWLAEIELLERTARGFWELRGWHGTGPVKTVAKLHAVNRLADDRMQVGGHAYAGTRGVNRVEVSLDGGTTWTEARLSEPLPDADVWRMWAYEWTTTADGSEVVVRAVDRSGTVQSRAESAAFPNGASGWVKRTVER